MPCRALRLLFPGVALLWTACAPTVRDPWGLSVVNGLPPPEVAVPNRLQADLELIPAAAGSLPVSVRFYAEPSHRYRADVFGFPAFLAASWRWEGGAWLLVRHDTREVRTGTGTGLDEADMPFRIPDVLSVFGFVWGAPLPGFPAGDATAVERVGGLVRWRHAGETWEAVLDPATGVCREVRSPSMSLRYSRHRRYGDLLIPERVEVLVDGGSVLTLQVREWKPDPDWKRNPFDLKAPGDYGTR